VAHGAGDLEEGPLAFAVGTGLKVLDVILEDEAAALAGSRGRHDPERTAVRHGSDVGLVTLGGRQVSITRPRFRSADRSSEVQLPTYQAASSTELLGRQAMAKMLAKLSTRRYAVGLEPVGSAVEARSQGTSKSSVSRRFVVVTESALGDLMAADLSALDLMVVMVDGVNFASHCCVVALGIDIEVLRQGGGAHRGRGVRIRPQGHGRPACDGIEVEAYPQPAEDMPNGTVRGLGAGGGGIEKASQLSAPATCSKAWGISGMGRS
jgi:hypothetical protein